MKVTNNSPDTIALKVRGGTVTIKKGKSATRDFLIGPDKRKELERRGVDFDDRAADDLSKDRDKLRREYQGLAGKEAAERWGAPRLTREIAALREAKAAAAVKVS